VKGGWQYTAPNPNPNPKTLYSLFALLICYLGTVLYIFPLGSNFQLQYIYLLKMAPRNLSESQTFIIELI